MSVSSQTMAAALRDLPPGEEMVFELPGAQPSNRDALMRLASVAYRLWGKGNYRVQSRPGRIAVFRKPAAAEAPHESAPTAARDATLS